MATVGSSLLLEKGTVIKQYSHFDLYHEMQQHLFLHVMVTEVSLFFFYYC